MKAVMTLGATIQFEGIKEAVRSKESLEFYAPAPQINLDSLSVQDLVKSNNAFRLPPLINKREIFKTLWAAETSNDSQKWDYLVLLTYLNDGDIFYQKADDGKYLVTILFNERSEAENPKE